MVDLLRSAEMGCDVSAVTITGGERERLIGRGSGPNWSVPKRNLMADVQVLLERRDLKIARALPHAGSLVRELMDVRMTPGAAGGRVKMGADGCGEHDDLVIALALACWRAKQAGPGRIVFGTRRLF